MYPALYMSGDGGIRTRVRRIQSTDVYERIRSISLMRSEPNDRPSHRTSHLTPKDHLDKARG